MERWESVYMGFTPSKITGFAHVNNFWELSSIYTLLWESDISPEKFCPLNNSFYPPPDFFGWPPSCMECKQHSGVARHFLGGKHPNFPIFFLKCEHHICGENLELNERKFMQITLKPADITWWSGDFVISRVQKSLPNWFMSEHDCISNCKLLRAIALLWHKQLQNGAFIGENSEFCERRVGKTTL